MLRGGVVFVAGGGERDDFDAARLTRSVRERRYARCFNGVCG